MPFSYLDAHTHVQFPAYDADRDAVIARAREAGVRMVNVGTTRKTSEAAVALARVYPELCYAAVGVHPSHASTSHHDVQEFGEPLANSHARLPVGQELANEEEFDSVFYRKLASERSVVAIGECGLDYAGFARARGARPQNRALATPTESASEFSPEEIEATKEKQRELFLAHMKFANEVGKPLMIHCRAAFPDLLQLLSTNYPLLSSNNPGVIHFFTGTPEEAKDLLALGFSFTFGGVITFARDYDDIIKMIPVERILSETDAPYVTPAPYRGTRNEPAYVVEVVKKLAELKGLSVEAMAARIRENAARVLGI